MGSIPKDLTPAPFYLVREYAREFNRATMLGSDDPDGDARRMIQSMDDAGIFSMDPPEIAANRSYFVDCPRDKKGRCLPKGTSRQGFASREEMTESFERTKRKIREAPVPPRREVLKARAEILRARRDGTRPGGEARGGSAADRRRQRQNLFNEFGGAEKGYVVCPWTGLKMHWSADPKDNPDGYPLFERGKIFTKSQGGGYQLRNLIPESFTANRSRNAKPLRTENRR